VTAEDLRRQEWLQRVMQEAQAREVLRVKALNTSNRFFLYPNAYTAVATDGLNSGFLAC
jgi:hypothetical protein